MDLAGIELDEMTFYADSGGAISVPLMSLTEDAVTNLLASGNWALQGENLVFAGGAVPEPGSIGLGALAAATGMLCWRRQRKWKRSVDA